MRATTKTARKIPNYHAHGCRQCGRRYMDTCKTPLENGVCMSPCTNGLEPPLWDRDKSPADCCRANSRLTTDNAVLNSYALGGPGPWFQCATCKRTHPFDPKGAIA